MFPNNLNEIQLTNFKSFSKTAKFPIRPITLIFGPNSSGKSSFLQSLLLLKQSLEKKTGRNLTSTGPLVNLGGYKNFINGHKKEKDFSLSFSFDLTTIDRLPKMLFLLDGPIQTQDELLSFLCFIIANFKNIRLLLSFTTGEDGLNTSISSI